MRRPRGLRDRIDGFRRYMKPSIYNYPVRFRDRFCIALAYTISLDLFGRVLWYLAPYSLVD